MSLRVHKLLSFGNHLSAQQLQITAEHSRAIHCHVSSVQAIIIIIITLVCILSHGNRCTFRQRDVFRSCWTTACCGALSCKRGFTSAPFGCHWEAFNSASGVSAGAPCSVMNQPFVREKHAQMSILFSKIKDKRDANEDESILWLQMPSLKER